jgi:hypothetical protein
MLSWTCRGNRASWFRVSDSEMGMTDVGFVEFSGGVENPRPEIFQSDCHNHQQRKCKRGAALPTLALMKMASGVRLACTSPALSCKNSKPLATCSRPF